MGEWWGGDKGKGKGKDEWDLMGWAMTMASMYGSPSWDGGKGKGGKGGSTSQPSNKVFVGALPKVVSEASVRQAFAPFGNIMEIKMMTGEHGESKGYCFVTFSTLEEAKQVLANYDNNSVDGKWVDCKPASQGSGGGGGGGGAMMKPGDWICPSCGDNVFAWRSACNRCGSAPGGMGGIDMAMAAMGMGGMGGKGGGGSGAMRPGDWMCPACGDLVFSSRDKCNRCGQGKPGGAQRMGMKPGDWTCPACGDLVFASKNVCSLCQTPKPMDRPGPY